MKIGERLSWGYIRNIKTIAALYVIALLLGWVLYILSTGTFREVYYIRIILTLVIGVPVSIFFNKYGIELWMARHQSKKGPAGAVDGAIIGSFIGAWTVMLPLFTSFIYSNDYSQAKTFILGCWIISVVIGGLFGGFLGMWGGRTLPRK